MAVEKRNIFLTQTVETKGIKVGLDIGVASVGWAVVDDEYTVLESGVNLFSEAAAANNEIRRSMRGARRLIRRRQTRIADFNKLWLANGFSIPDSHILNIVETEVRALSEAVSNDELYDILKAILKHSGISYLEDGDVKGSSEYAEGVKQNQTELMTTLPCEIQLERLRTYGFYRGQSVVGDIVISNVFTISKYREQAAKILETQLQYNDRLTEDFAADFMELFNRITMGREMRSREQIMENIQQGGMKTDSLLQKKIFLKS